MFAYYYVHLALRSGRAYCVVDHVAQDAADFGSVGAGYHLWSARGHDGLRVKQSDPINFAARQGPKGYRSKIKIDPGIQPCGGKQVRDEGTGSFRLAYQQGLQMLALVMAQLIIMVQQRFGSGLDPGDWGPQFVRRICKEGPSAFLRLSGPSFRTLELIQHFVERLGGLAEFGIGTGRRQPIATVALADSLGERSHRVERPQREANCCGDEHSADCQCDHCSDHQYPAQRTPGS